MEDHRDHQPEPATADYYKGGRISRERLTYAITRVIASTAACAKHGDAATVAVLTEYYRIAAEAAAAAGGSVVKVMGCGVLFEFPIAGFKNTLAQMRDFQRSANKLWGDFDPRCSVQIKVGTGSLMRVQLEVAGAEHTDIYGDALNQLFKMPWTDFTLSAEMRNGKKKAGN